MAFKDNFKGKKGVVFALGGSAALLGVLYWRKHNAASAASAASQTASTGVAPSAGDPYPSDGTTGDPGDPYSVDPATGMTYGDESASGSGGFGDFGFTPFPGAGLGDGGTGAAPSAPGPGSFTSNAQWAQYAEQQLAGVVSGPHLSAALGKYLTGQPATADQKSLIDQAIAIAGYPPVAGPSGFPPAIHTAGSGGGGQGGGGGGHKHRQKKFITANGHQDLFEIASAHGLSERKLVQLNPGLKHLEGTKKKVHKGTRVRIS